MARTGWVYTLRDWDTASEQSHAEWLREVRGEGWKLWMPRQTWEGSLIWLNGRQVIRHSLRRWAGPGPEPAPTWDPAEGPADS
jgi:hypothetical protein